MPLPMPVPAWLSVTPGQHAQASESGLSAGIQAAHIYAQAAAERERLAQSARQHDLEAALESERLQQKSVYEAQKLAADVAYNKAALSQAEARIKQTQDNAARMAQQWAAQNQLAQQREERLGTDAASRMALAQQREGRTGSDAAARLALAQQREDRLKQAMENKGVSEDAALAAYAKTAREGKEAPGLLSKIGTGISDFFTGRSTGGTIVPPKIGGSPHAEGEYVRNKKDGKLYVIRGGLPVLVDDNSKEESEPEPDQDTSE